MTIWDYKDKDLEIIFEPPRYGIPHKATVKTTVKTTDGSNQEMVIERGLAVWYHVEENEVIYSSEDPREVAWTWFNNLKKVKEGG